MCLVTHGSELGRPTHQLKNNSKNYIYLYLYIHTKRLERGPLGLVVKTALKTATVLCYTECTNSPNNIDKRLFFFALHVSECSYILYGK